MLSRESIHAGANYAAQGACEFIFNGGVHVRIFTIACLQACSSVRKKRYSANIFWVAFACTRRLIFNNCLTDVDAFGDVLCPCNGETCFGPSSKSTAPSELAERGPIDGITASAGAAEARNKGHINLGPPSYQRSQKSASPAEVHFPRKIGNSARQVDAQHFVELLGAFVPEGFLSPV